MDFVKTIGGYKAWFYPRKHIYRISPVENPMLIMHKDFKSLDEIVRLIDEKYPETTYADPYNIAINWLKSASKDNEDYKAVNVLADQYYYGIEAKKELKNKLIEMKLISA